ncbi:hypothetical protein OG21DRAFT_1522517 [Imleria badia]|nr:hypothetical protein OG21DRAFT_1522517 [Imleria badia]
MSEALPVFNCAWSNNDCGWTMSRIMWMVVDVETHLDGPPLGPPQKGKTKGVMKKYSNKNQVDAETHLDGPPPGLPQKGKTYGYPDVIDFITLPIHINKMLEIKSLIRAATSGDLIYLEENFIFHCLVYDILQVNIGTASQDALVNFSALRYSAIPNRIQEKSWPGYYDPIGYEVIYNTIIDQVEAKLPQSFHPLSADQLVQFVLIPTIACQLVMEDQQIDLQVAYKKMIHSAKVGEALQQLEPDHAGTEDSNMKIVKIAAAEDEAGPSRFQGCLDDKVPEDQC